MNIKKRILIFLLCGIVAIFLVGLAFFAYKKAEGHLMEYVKHHRAEWIDLLANNKEVLSYLEQLYTIDELTINFWNGELTINESASNMFSINELENLDNLFVKFQWETIRVRKQTDAKEKVLEVISSQIVIGNFFRKHYGAAFLVYSPNDNPRRGEEIFPKWYYEALFNT